jgi:hypothetical protein
VSVGSHVRIKTRTLWVAVWTVLCCQPLVTAQTILIVGKCGVSSYGTVYIGSVGGGGGDHNWKTGPIFGIGARIRTSDTFAAEGVVEYSFHRYDSQWSGQISNDPLNGILELTAIPRWSIGIYDVVYLDILGGLGISYQHLDGKVVTYGTSQYTGPHTDLVVLSGLLGIGLEVRVSKSIELSLEGSWRLRTYVTPVAQLVIAYAL